jgi:hypothetical protein
VTMRSVPVPATYCGSRGERFRCAARRGEACRGGWMTGVSHLLTARCRRVPTGRTVLLRLLPHTVRQCGACPGAVYVVVTVGANLRFKAMPRYHNNLRRGRRPRRPLFGLPPTFVSNQRTLLCGCGQVPLVFLRALRVGTRGCGAYATAQGAVRVGFATFWLPPAGTYLWHIGLKPVTRQLCQDPDVRTRTIAAPQIPKPKSGFFGSFLAKTRKEPPAA